VLAGWCLALAAALPTGTIDAGDPGVAALILVRGASDDITRPIIDWLRARTDLVPRSAEQAGIDLARVSACPADSLFTCLTRTAGAIDVRWLLFVSVRGDELALFALDLDAAKKILEGAPVEDAEDRLYAQVVVVRMPVQQIELADALDGELAARLSALGHLDPYGEISFETDVGPTHVIDLDGRSLGSTDATIITRVRPGSHTITVSDALARRTGTVVVAARRRAEIALLGAPVEPDRTWGYVGGAASLSLGVAALIAGAVDTAGAPTQLCLRRAGAPCEPATPLGPPILEPDGRGRSPWLGVGVGLGLLGAIWLAGSAFLDDGALWGLGLGLGAGGVSAGVVLAL